MTKVRPAQRVRDELRAHTTSRSHARRCSAWLALCLALAACGPGAAAPTAPSPALEPPGNGTPYATVEAEATRSVAGYVAASPLAATTSPTGVPVASPAVVSSPPVERLRPEIVSARPHDSGAFTQGLVWDDGLLLESAGLYGQSSLRRVDPATGAVLAQVAVAPDRFAEGLAAVGDRIIQLTWRENVAMIYDRASLAPLDEMPYAGEGWGLCYDGERLVRSDGSANLFFHDPATLELLGHLPVTLAAQPVANLNELECVGDHVYANVWQTDQILRIASDTGVVDATIDASGLLSPAERPGADVLNGIAYDPAAGTFLITGKLWPRLFEVRFVPAANP